jgi:hypothetical protein
VSLMGVLCALNNVGKRLFILFPVYRSSTDRSEKNRKKRSCTRVCGGKCRTHEASVQLETGDRLKMVEKTQEKTKQRQ